jgi:hypothetical protein
MQNKTYAQALAELRRERLEPRAVLWTRIEDSLWRRRTFGLPARWLCSAAALAVLGLAVLGGTAYYEQYRLERYLASSLDYTSYSSQLYASGTFLQSGLYK